MRIVTIEFALTIARFFVFVALTLRLTRPLIQIFHKAQRRRGSTFVRLFQTAWLYFSRVPEFVLLVALYVYYVNRLFVIGLTSPVTLEDALFLDIALGGYWLLEALPFRQRRHVDQEATQTHFR